MNGIDIDGWAAQFAGLFALGFIIAAFSSRQDDRLLVYLIFANVAFGVQFGLFGQWVAVGMSVLIVVRIMLARRFPRNLRVMGLMLAVSLAVALVTWRHWFDLFPLLAALLGTLAMFLFRGIAMRILLAGVALSWLINALIIGSIGGAIAEALALGTNLFTLWRLSRFRARQASAD